MLLPAGSESHSYEPTARDIIDVQNCDLFIYTGAESDVWIDKILNSLDNRVNTLKMTDCVQLLPIGGHEHDDVEFDEHVWTSPVNSLRIIDCIKDKISTKKFIVACGIEAHICVLQTVIDLKAAGFVPVLVADCISSRKESDKQVAIERARQEGAIVTTYESLLFELLKVAGTETSKKIQKLIR